MPRIIFSHENQPMTNSEATRESNFDKKVALVIVAFLIGTGSAILYTNLYSNSVSYQIQGSHLQTPAYDNVEILAGSSVSPNCYESYPCATVYHSELGVVSLSFSLFPSVEQQNGPQPETYYTDLIRIQNLNHPTNITSVTVSNITSTSPRDFGRVTVFYCLSQTNFPAQNCENNFNITSTTGGFVFSGIDTLQPNAERVIEVAGFANADSSIGDQISFILTIS